MFAAGEEKRTVSSCWPGSAFQAASCRLFSNHGDERNSGVLCHVAAGEAISCFRDDSTATAFIHSMHTHWCLFLYSGKLAGSRKDRMRLGYLVCRSLTVIPEQQTSCLPNTHPPFWISIFFSLPQSMGTGVRLDLSLPGAACDSTRA